MGQLAKDVAVVELVGEPVGGVDTDLFNGDMADLMAFAVGDGVLPNPDLPPEESAIPCPVSRLGQTLIQEDGPCAKRLGPVDVDQYVDVGGSAGHAWWTVADESTPDYTEGVAWLFDFELEGEYQLWAHVPGGVENLTHGAHFEVEHAAGTTLVVVDQSAGGVALIGTFAFNEGAGGQQVRAFDSYAAAGDEGRRVAFDAIELGPASVCSCSEQGGIETLSCDDGGTLTRVCDGCHWSDWSACMVDDAGASDVAVDASGDVAGAVDVGDDGPVLASEDAHGSTDAPASRGDSTSTVESDLIGTSTDVHVVAVQSTVQGHSTTGRIPGSTDTGCQGGSAPGVGWLAIWMLCVFCRRQPRRRVSNRATP